MIPPPDTDPEVFRHGQHVATVWGESSWAIERWVRAVAEHAGARVDWRQVGGRGFVLHLGGEESRGRVEAAMMLLAPTLAGEILEGMAGGRGEDARQVLLVECGVCVLLWATSAEVAAAARGAGVEAGSDPFGRSVVSYRRNL